MSDFLTVLTWWALAQLLGLAALPLAFRLFRRLPDRGYGISKALGLLLTAYVFWLLGVLGFVRNDSGGILLSLGMIAGLSLYLYRRGQTARAPISLSAWLREHWRLVLATELVFAATFFGWVLYRAYVPRITTSGGEKFMELAFLNGLRRSATLPPLDPWLSGYAISYYYFGYVMMSSLIRLSGVAPAVGFNVGAALWFALTATGAFSLVYNLAGQRLSEPATGSRRWAVGGRRALFAVALLGALFVVLLSNYEAPLEVAHWQGVGGAGFWEWLDIADLDRPPPGPQARQAAPGRLVRPDTGPGWGWWWRASRVISDYNLRDWPNRYDETAEPSPHRRENIDEFPAFSFLHGDMHPHILALPFVMLALTASLALFQIRDFDAGVWRLGLARWELLALALLFGALGFLNTWDFPIHWAVAVGAYGLGRLTRGATDPQSERLAESPAVPRPVSNAGVEPVEGLRQRPELAEGLHQRPVLGDVDTKLVEELRSIVTLALTLALGGLLLYLPFYVGFQSQAGGVLVHVQSSTRLAQFGVMFGPLLLILLPFLAWGLNRIRRHDVAALRTGLRVFAALLLLALGLLLATALAILISPRVRELVAQGGIELAPGQIALRYLAMRLGNPWVTLLLTGMIGAAVALLRSGRFSRAVRFSLLLTAAGALMTLTPEYVYLKDVFGVRLNTIFKFYYQAWILWAVAAAGAVYALLVAEDGLRPLARRLFGLGLALVAGLGLLYPLLAIPDRANEFFEAPTLDGTVYFETEQPADYAAVQWLNARVEGAPTILETPSTPGGGYQYEGRIAAQTGLPTLLGWGGHERQWRGNTIVQDRRRPVIEELYSTTDVQRTLTLLREYDITYVYVGPLERAKWPASGLDKFDRLMEVVYDRDDVKIYKRRETPGGRAGE